MKIHDIISEGIDPTQHDIQSVAEWMDTTVDNLQFNIVQEPISKYIQAIKEMYGTYDEFPEDARRTNRILTNLRRGEKALPMYVAENDPHLFVMEGRHRMVAFWLAGMTEIPVAYVSKRTNE